MASFAANKTRQRRVQNCKVSDCYWQCEQAQMIDVSLSQWEHLRGVASSAWFRCHTNSWRWLAWFSANGNAEGAWFSLSDAATVWTAGDALLSKEARRSSGDVNSTNSSIPRIQLLLQTDDTLLNDSADCVVVKTRLDLLIFNSVKRFGFFVCFSCIFIWIDTWSVLAVT